jgi:hydrogenase maturation protease
VPGTLILGIGNTLMGDDGVGVQVADALSERGDLGADIEVISAHTTGYGFAGALARFDRVLVVDAIEAGGEAGSVYRFSPADTGLMNLRSGTSHGLGVPELVAAAQLGGVTAEIIVYAIQVAVVSPTATALSPQLQEALPEIIEMVLRDARGEGAPPLIGDASSAAQPAPPESV